MSNKISNPVDPGTVRVQFPADTRLRAAAQGRHGPCWYKNNRESR